MGSRTQGTPWTRTEWTTWVTVWVDHWKIQFLSGDPPGSSLEDSEVRSTGLRPGAGLESSPR